MFRNQMLEEIYQIRSAVQEKAAADSLYYESDFNS